VKDIHTPQIGFHYWIAISMASIFGTNLGDLYAHESGLGIARGLLLLSMLFAATMLFERSDKKIHTAYYWIGIIIIRTGATNIADFMAGHRGLGIDRLLLTAVFAVLLAAVAWLTRPSTAAPQVGSVSVATAKPPAANTVYWLGMLVAGILGTVFGDYCSHSLGGDAATLLLSLVVLLFLYVGRTGLLATAWYYWLAIAVVRTAGTAMGDWIEKNKYVDVGLPLSTLLTGVVFLLALMAYRNMRAQSVRVA